MQGIYLIQVNCFLFLLVLESSQTQLWIPASRNPYDGGYRELKTKWSGGLVINLSPPSLPLPLRSIPSSPPSLPFPLQLNNGIRW